MGFLSACIVMLLLIRKFYLKIVQALKEIPGFAKVGQFQFSFSTDEKLCLYTNIVLMLISNMHVVY